MGRRTAAVVGAGLIMLVSAVAFLALDTDARGLLPGAPDCTVTVGDREVGLSGNQAVSASRTVARVVRRGGTAATAAAALDPSFPAGDRRAVASALTGRSPAALSCTYGAAAQGSVRLTPSGLVPRARDVRREVDRVFGAQKVGGFAPGGVSTGHSPGSAHYEGRAVDVFVRPVDAPHLRQGWAMAQYLVANAERLDVATVIFDGRIWTARRSFQGWRDYTPDVSGRSRAVAAILEHRDHVHVDVA
jgi:hypothetical protein